MVMGRALPGETGERFAVNSNLETPPPPQLPLPRGDACQIGATDIHKGPAGKEGRERGNLGTRQVELLLQPRSPDKASVWPAPLAVGDGPTL